MRWPSLITLLLVPAALDEQTPATVTLGPATARLAVEFSDLTSVRELSDGRVLLFDRKEERLMVVGFSDASVRDIGRRGQGPGEYQFISRLLALGGDSTLAADLNRWLIVSGDSIVATLPPDTPAIRAVSLWPLAADHQGRVLSRHFARERERDSAYVVLVDRASGRSDTVARLRVGVRRAPARTVTINGERVMQVTRIPLDVRETPILFFDGWLAIARLDPYRVDWRTPEGQWVRGAPLPFRAIRMTERERRACAQRSTWAQDATDWPETLPPFDAGSIITLFAAPDGLLVIRRLPTADQPETRYDLVDRRGALRAQLVLATNEHILGFGAQSVYVITTDDDGIQRVSRHRWPVVPRPAPGVRDGSAIRPVSRTSPSLPS